MNFKRFKQSFPFLSFINLQSKILRNCWRERRYEIEILMHCERVKSGVGVRVRETRLVEDGSRKREERECEVVLELESLRD